MNGALDFRDVAVRYGAAPPVLAGLNLTVTPGEVVAVIGRSGCGKTTLLHLAAGLLVPQAGQVTFGGEVRTGYVFQEPRLLPWLTLEGNLRLTSPPDRHGHISAELARVGLRGQERRYPGELSLGMAQRAAVARALLLRPNLLLLDEPFSALDELTASELRAELAGLLRETRPTTLLVTHNPAEAVFLADRVVALAGTPAAVRGEVRVTLPRPRDPDDPAAARAVREVRQLLGGERVPV
ncbi:ABC transporter ATP-binding protein [Deinococcus aluminii]|uniref:Bicarbonate transport ATP-binding protein CmpD n=1 Tax=Deinococcus aluminii TaxID=1656885 RepID=A0ABP9XFT0_9DEIO